MNEFEYSIFPPDEVLLSPFYFGSMLLIHSNEDIGEIRIVEEYSPCVAQVDAAVPLTKVRKLVIMR